MFGDVGHARTNAAMLLLPMLQPQAALAQNPLLCVRSSTLVIVVLHLIYLSKLIEVRQMKFLDRLKLYLKVSHIF